MIDWSSGEYIEKACGGNHVTCGRRPQEHANCDMEMQENIACAKFYFLWFITV